MWFGKEGVLVTCRGLELSFELLTRLIVLNLGSSLDLGTVCGTRDSNWGVNWGREITMRKLLLSSFDRTHWIRISLLWISMIFVVWWEIKK